jgi:hypothetical protein
MFEGHLIPVIESDDYGGAGIDSDSIDAGDIHDLRIAFVFGAITGDSVLKVYSGATTGTKTTAETFKYRLYGGDFKAASADVPGARASSAALTLTAATYDHRLLEVYVRPDQLTAGQNWITVEISNVANPINVGAVGVAHPRYSDVTVL